MTLGIRFEHETPVSERFNRAVKGFDYTAVNPISAQATANYARNPIPELPLANFKVLGGLQFAGGNNGHYLWNGEALNVLPRIAAAYQLNSKTVLRAGYGIFYDTVGTNRYNQALSERRAASVKAEMTRLGLDGVSIMTSGKSFSEPLIATGPGVREPQNRRAVIDLRNPAMAENF